MLIFNSEHGEKINRLIRDAHFLSKKSKRLNYRYFNINHIQSFVYSFKYYRVNTI
ncbi:hypothetical protein LCDVSa058L [Lymphocystis disease virus 3]|uniref:Uncharacterized protein n=1 Tax=Lymphocystis disease virus 3 TaxID=2560566 RepID=A0A1B2RVW9_9VIRU|nr:hypothetical protein BZK12_gp058 [Lymphocystis disease virus Sa]AOC55142.1 hypothetical protein LCDVSa058L [Lymphocystis disease virus 3]